MITAVDVGATKTLVTQFSENGEPVEIVRFLTPEDPGVFLGELTRELSKLSKISVISMGIPGTSRDGIVVGCPNLPLWKNFALESGLNSVHRCPIYIENDANLAGLSEVNLLDPMPQVGLYLTVSTGIGDGLVLDGQLSPAIKHGRMGHMVFFFEGKWQEWEHFASGRAVVSRFGKIASDLTDPRDWQAVAERLAVGICAIIPAVRPEVIVFGGGVGAQFDHFAAPLEAILNQRFPKFALPALKKAQHPNEAVLYGCYYNAINQNKH